MRTVTAILRTLHQTYPDARCGLAYRSRFQLLIAVILSAQTTDRSVNAVTPELFRRFGTAAGLAAARPPQVEKLIRRLGLFRNKTRSIIAAARLLVEEYGGRVPGERAALLRLHGVGRKTANVVLGEGFKVPAVTVDTHVSRLAQRLGWSAAADPLRIEHDLMALLPRREWIALGHLLIAHGRAVCAARRPVCGQCCIYPQCPWEGKK